MNDIIRAKCRINRYAKYATVGVPALGCLENNFHYQASLGPSHRLPYCGYVDCTYETIGIPQGTIYAAARDAILSSMLMPVTRTCIQVTVERVDPHELMP